MTLFRYQTPLTLLISLTLMTGCSEGWQQRLAADSELQDQQETTQQQSEQSEQSETTASEIKNRIPETIPLYPQTQLVEEEIDEQADSGTIEWLAAASGDEITEFYEQQLSEQDWEIITPFSQSNNDQQQLKARSRSLDLTVTVDSKTDQQGTQIVLEYEPLSSQQTETEQSQPTEEQETAETTNSKQQEDSSASVTEFDGTFTDLDETPDELKNYVQDMANLGILTPVNQKEVEKEAQSAEFAPNEPITRGTFARWLLKANNTFYRDHRGKQVDPASQADATAFEDISQSDPSFSAIQGLAEAGIIPSPLGNEDSDNRFRPNDPLTRETLLQWKVPLDARSRLPSADLEDVEESWGFQDASKIEEKALSAIVADYENEEHSNIRRVYGYTQLLQPQKPVTRAEAAAALWSFGSGEEVITAQELLQEKDSNGES